MCCWITDTNSRTHKKKFQFIHAQTNCEVYPRLWQILKLLFNDFTKKSNVFASAGSWLTCAGSQCTRGREDTSDFSRQIKKCKTWGKNSFQLITRGVTHKKFEVIPVLDLFHSMLRLDATGKKLFDSRLFKYKKTSIKKAIFTIEILSSQVKAHKRSDNYANMSDCIPN